MITGGVADSSHSYLKEQACPPSAPEASVKRKIHHPQSGEHYMDLLGH